MSTDVRPPMQQTPEKPQPRRRPRTAFLVLGAVGLVVVGGAFVAGWTPVMGVQEVRVDGAGEVPAEAIAAAAAIPTGTPMMRVDLRGATARISDLPQVSGVDITREWPRTVVISVQERSAVAARTAGSSWELIDTNGAAFAVTDRKPKDLPSLDGLTDEAIVLAVVHALQAMPQPVRAKIATVEATAPDSLRFRLRGDNAVVVWGSADQSDFKGRVLGVLLSRKSQWYDVSTPETPTTADEDPRAAATPLPTDTSSPAVDAADPAATPEASPSAVPSMSAESEVAVTP